jgi:hypothetical protein
MGPRFSISSSTRSSLFKVGSSYARLRSLNVLSVHIKDGITGAKFRLREKVLVSLTMYHHRVLVLMTILCCHMVC